MVPGLDLLCFNMKVLLIPPSMVCSLLHAECYCYFYVADCCHAVIISLTTVTLATCTTGNNDDLMPHSGLVQFSVIFSCIFLPIVTAY